MILKSKRGSITIFQIICFAFIIATFSLLTSSLIKDKIENNLKRTEKLVSESILNTYNEDLYQGFSLLAYEYNEEIESDITSFYERKYNVNIHTSATKYLSDYNMVDQMKLVVISRLGVSYLDDITKKMDVKKDIISNISRAKKIVSDMDSKLEKYDEIISIMSSLSEVFVDIKNGITINSLDERYDLERMVDKLDKIIELDTQLKNISSESAFSYEKFNLSLVKIGNMTLKSNDNDDWIQIIYSLKDAIYKSNNGLNELEKTDENLFKISERISIFHENNDDINKKIKFSNLFKNIKEINKNASKESSEFAYFEEKDVEELQLVLSPIDKLAFIEYMTIMLSDQVRSGMRDHFYTSRSSVDGYQNSELEYVITGLSNSDSKQKVRNYIRTIRFPLNLIHIYTSKEKLDLINSLSASIAAVSQIPPFVSSPVIAAAWSYVETECDLIKIYRGESVANIKVSNEDWESDFGFLNSLIDTNTDLNSLKYESNNVKFDLEENKIEKKENLDKKSEIQSNEIFNLYYNDYLRLMALATSSSKMMARFKLIVNEYLGVDEFDINNLLIEHKVDIFMDERRNRKFKESLVDGYIN